MNDTALLQAILTKVSKIERTQKKMFKDIHERLQKVETKLAVG